MFEKAWFEKTIEEGPEIMLYFIIDQIGSFTFHMNHGLAHNRIQGDTTGVDADIQTAREQQKLAVKKLTRFGVEKPTDGEHDAPTPEYWLWYRWWNSYIESLSTEEFDALNLAMEENADLSKWRPQGDWKPQTEIQPEP